MDLRAQDQRDRGRRRLGFSVHDADSPMPRTADGSLDTVALFGRSAPLVLEIGSGMGETTATMAAADPSRDYLAVEAHLPGVANLLGLPAITLPTRRPACGVMLMGRAGADRALLRTAAGAESALRD